MSIFLLRWLWVLFFLSRLIGFKRQDHVCYPPNKVRHSRPIKVMVPGWALIPIVDCLITPTPGLQINFATSSQTFLAPKHIEIYSLQQADSPIFLSFHPCRWILSAREQVRFQFFRFWPSRFRFNSSSLRSVSFLSGLTFVPDLLTATLMFRF